MKPGEVDEFGECMHLQQVDLYTICKDYQSVYVTAGGMHFHLNPRCNNLLAGWEEVSANGGSPAPLETVSLAKAKELGRKPRKLCKLCKRSRHLK